MRELRDDVEAMLAAMPGLKDPCIIVPPRLAELARRALPPHVKVIVTRKAR